MATSTENPPPNFLGRFTRSFFKGMKQNWMVNALFVVLVMAVAAIVVAINAVGRTNDQNVQLRHLVECQNRYNTINNTRTRLLSEAAERESRASAEVDDAFTALTEALIRQPDNSQQAIQLRGVLLDKLQAQQVAREQTILERRMNPVPPPPNALCGEPPSN